jgi:5-methylcytosine-specific restriction endonuclease McrA
VIRIERVDYDGYRRRHWGKPLIGKAFSYRQCALVALKGMQLGFPVVTYSVIEVRSGAAIGVGETKGEAISLARKFMSAPQAVLETLFYEVEEQKNKRLQELDDLRRAEAKQRRVAVNRAAVYDKSSGKCHYCAISLERDGTWHVEHMTPVSRGGSSEMDNLVASCVPCNVSKGTKTASEFNVERMEALQPLMRAVK